MTALDPLPPPVRVFGVAGRGLILEIALSVLAAALQPSAAAGSLCEDRDHDGYFAEAGCGTPVDCNDDDYFAHPGAAETCNGIDDDCNGLVDDSPACDTTCDNPERFPATTLVSLSSPNRADTVDLAWVGDGWVVAYQTYWNNGCSFVAIRKLARDGTALGDPLIVDGGLGIELSAVSPRLTWTGRELGVVWESVEEQSTACARIPPEGYDLYFQRYTQDLRPVGDRVRLSACLPSGDDQEQDIAWSGRRYGIAWLHESSDVWFDVIDRDGVPADTCGEILDSAYGHEQLSIAWGRQGWFGVTWPLPGFTDSPYELYFRRVGDDLVLPDAALRETFDASASTAPHLVWADGEWGLSWSDERDHPGLHANEIYFMRLDAVGAKLDPPGDTRVTCCSDGTIGPRRLPNRIRFTGQEYGIGYTEIYNRSLFTGDVLFQRVSKSGAIVGAPVLVTPDSLQHAKEVAMDWNGHSYGFAWADLPSGATDMQVYFARVGCNCTDSDGDGYTSCAGNDCNDADPLVHPGAVESCLDGADNNCDGKTDCQDTAACPAKGGHAPGEVVGLVIGADKQTWSWQTEPASQSYDLLIGDLDILRARGDFSLARCLAMRVIGSSYLDSTRPIPTTGSYVLVRGKADTCRLGTWGSTLRDAARLTCP